MPPQSRNEQSLFSRWSKILASMVRKIHPMADKSADDVLLAQELRRLASLSPHLLSDVGLTLEKKVTTVQLFPWTAETLNQC